MGQTHSGNFIFIENPFESTPIVMHPYLPFKWFQNIHLVHARIHWFIALIYFTFLSTLTNPFAFLTPPTTSRLSISSHFKVSFQFLGAQSIYIIVLESSVLRIIPVIVQNVGPYCSISNGPASQHPAFHSLPKHLVRDHSVFKISYKALF